MIIKLKKFRAWDRQERKMLSSKEFSGEKDLYLTLNGGIMKVNPVGNRYAIAEESYPIMQYIGIEDKEGVEIYEGDILEVAETASLLQARLLGKEMLESWVYRGVVEYDMEGADFQINPGNEDDIRGFTTDQTREVIGNIWENPGLLDVKR